MDAAAQTERIAPVARPGHVAVIGLGYVGLPLALALGRHRRTTGFDLNTERIRDLRERRDTNRDLDPGALQSPNLSFSHDEADLAGCEFYLVAVPTPVDPEKRPDLSYLRAASRTVGRALRARAPQGPTGPPPVVVYESTVYPGCTEEVCVPEIEDASGLRCGKDFKIGYSPERINPGDPEHTLEKVVKVVSGQDRETLDRVDSLYRSIVAAGTHRAPDIRTAEAAKVIENTQRDLNIALMNELSKLFDLLGLDTKEVLKAARTKWNFLPFEPGLVGGHCIPEDPYYLTFKAEQVGFHPEVILAGRRTNDQMGTYVAARTLHLLQQANRRPAGSRVLVLGATFKENVADLRSTLVVDVVRGLERAGAQVNVHDPMVTPGRLSALRLEPVDDPFSQAATYDAVVLAVPHRDFRARGPEEFINLLDRANGPGVLVDVKGTLTDPSRPDILYWRL